MKSFIEIILNDILKEASKGQVPTYISGKRKEPSFLKVGFSTQLENKVFESSSSTCFKIEHYQEFVDALCKYAEQVLSKEYVWTSVGTMKLSNIQKDNLDSLYCFLHDNILFMLLNSTKEDFLSPISVVERYTDFLKNEKMGELCKTSIYHFDTLNCDMEIQLEGQLYGQETPFALCCSLKGDSVDGMLPRIRFGVTKENGEDVMYLYALQNSSKKNLNYRKLYQLNESIPKELQTMAPSFVLAMGVVVSLMKKYDIQKLYMPHGLPLKMKLKYQGAITEEEAKKYDPSRLRSIGLRTVEQVKKIDQNMNENFVNCAKRIAYHGSDIQIQNIDSSNLLVTVDHTKNHFSNAILNELYTKLPIYEKGLSK